MGEKDVIKALTTLYLEDPCGVQPNALWKTIKEIPHFKYQLEQSEDRTSKLVFWNERMLHTYWDKTNFGFKVDGCDQDNWNMMILHQSIYDKSDIKGFGHRTAYFRLLHNSEANINDFHLAHGYQFREVDFVNEVNAVADFICKCYDEIKPGTDDVVKWSKHPVFHADLWLWIVDIRTNQEVALGIAELDKNIQEGSLEWIQVLPEHRGKGLGRMLVSELIRRLLPLSRFITVSGETNNRTNPEYLYRACGFTGEDIWYVLRK